MADESPLGTEALRRNVATARAVSGANQFAMQPPVDPLPPPWMQPPIAPPGTPPPNGRVATSPLPPATPTPVVASAPKPKTPKKVKVGTEEVEQLETPKTKLEKAWKLLHRILTKYATDMGTNVPRANLSLGQQLMQNGALLLRYGIPMEQVNQLVRLARDLAQNKNVEEEEGGDVAELRRMLERDDTTLPPLQAHNAEPDGEGEDEDNG